MIDVLAVLVLALLFVVLWGGCGLVILTICGGPEWLRDFDRSSRIEMLVNFLGWPVVLARYL